MGKDISTEKTKKSKKELPPPVEEHENDIEQLEDDSSDDEEEDDDADEEEEGVPLSDIDSDMEEDVDIVPYQRKPHKDNHAALTQALSTFALPLSSLPYNAHLSVTATEDITIDVNDDLNRELAFYKQALEAATLGRKKLTVEGVPFSRPSDYFAEMVKDDEHMDKVIFRIVWC
jgi:rRNA-processing protein EBP2